MMSFVYFIYYNKSRDFLMFATFASTCYFVFRVYHASMFIAIIGLRFSGKSTVENYLATKGFTSVRLHDKDVEAGPAKHPLL